MMIARLILVATLSLMAAGCVRLRCPDSIEPRLSTNGFPMHLDRTFHPLHMLIGNERIGPPGAARYAGIEHLSTLVQTTAPIRQDAETNVPTRTASYTGDPESSPRYDAHPPGSVRWKNAQASNVNFPGFLTRTQDCPFPPNPPAASERVKDRREMVNTQIASPRDGRTSVRRPDVLAAMRAVPRHVMVPSESQWYAYSDSPLPIGHGQKISQPYIVAMMTELLELSPNDRVLEIGTGSGYQAAVLAHITPHVYSIEIIEPLYRRARRILKAQGYDCIRLKHGDGYYGWPEQGPYDAIIVTCAAGHLPPALWGQLKKGGRIVIPIGGTHEVQRLVVATKQEDGSRTSRTIMPVRFVPLTRGG